VVCTKEQLVTLLWAPNVEDITKFLSAAAQCYTHVKGIVMSKGTEMDCDAARTKWTLVDKTDQTADDYIIAVSFTLLGGAYTVPKHFNQQLIQRCSVIYAAQCCQIAVYTAILRKSSGKLSLLAATF
jgi:hypothetical protein